MPINASRTALWKADIERSIDFYNDWFLRFAPETFRAQRGETTNLVADAFQKTKDLRSITPDVLQEHPAILSILRMACAPPIARDRLIGLAHIKKNLVQSMEGKAGQPPRVPPKMPAFELIDQLQRISDTIYELIDRDLLPWLEDDREPDDEQRIRAAMIVADRLCGASADPIIRNAQEKRQLDVLGKWLDNHGYQNVPPAELEKITDLKPGCYTFRANVLVQNRVNISVDCAVQPHHARSGAVPILIEAKSAGDVTNTNKRRKEEAQKFHQLTAEYGESVKFILFLCGYFEAGYLGYEASEGLDWVWEHRVSDFEALLGAPSMTDNGSRVSEPTVTYQIATESKEAQRHIAQQRVDATRTQLQRNRLGQFSTPFALAYDIVTEAVSLWRESGFSDVLLRFLEPALGSGVFFSALDSTVAKEQLDLATGVELDTRYADIAARLWSHPSYEVFGGLDFLAFVKEYAERDDLLYNLLCTNPPYVRHHHLTLEQKSELKQRVENTLGLRPSGLSGLYVYFVLLAHTVLAKGAVASWLIPSEFLVVNYGEVLREYLLKHVTLKQIHKFDSAEVQFDDALVSSCIVTYVVEEPTGSYEFIYSHGGAVSAPSEVRQVGSESLSPRSKWTFMQSGLHNKPDNQQSTRVGDLFDVKRGIATGSNRFFMVDTETIEAYEIPDQFLKPILPSPRYIKNEIVRGNDNGFPLVDGAKYLLDCNLPSDIVAERYPGLWRYLQEGIVQGISDGYLCANRKIWYAQEQRDPALYMATYMSRSRSKTINPFRFFLNLSDAVGTNVFLLLYPKPAFKRALYGQGDRMLEILALLNGLAGEYVISEGRTYGGGLHKLEPGELANLSLGKQLDWYTVPRQLSLAF